MQCFCCMCVSEDEIGAIERWGEYEKMTEPGFSCVPWPMVCLADKVVSTRVKVLTATVTTKTKDDVFVQLLVSVQYFVPQKGAYNAVYMFDDPEDSLGHYVTNYVRAVVPTMELDEVFTDLSKIKSTVKENLASVMELFGYELVDTLVIDLEPARKVKFCMNEVQVQQRMRVAAFDHAEAKKITTVTAAEADVINQKLSGEGMARMRQAIVGGLRESVDQFDAATPGLSKSTIMDMVLVNQFFDYLSDVGLWSKRNMHQANCPGEYNFLYHNPGALSDIKAGFKNIVNNGLA